MLMGLSGRGAAQRNLGAARETQPGSGLCMFPVVRKKKDSRKRHKLKGREREPERTKSLA